MFKKILSSIGIGSAQVDLVLDQNQVTMGDTITGKLIVKGGSVDQQIGDITVDFRVRSRYQHGDNMRSVDQVVGSAALTEAFTIKAKETQEFDFSYTVPHYLPVSSSTTHYVFHTNLGIEAGLDSSDNDHVTVHPSGLLRNFMEGFKLLGCTVKGEGYTGHIQMFSFYLTSWMRGKLDELEFQFDPAETQHGTISGFFEVDKKVSGVGGWLADELDLDERKGRFRFSAAQLSSPEQAADTIRAFVEDQYGRIQV